MNNNTNKNEKSAPDKKTGSVNRITTVIDTAAIKELDIKEMTSLSGAAGRSANANSPCLCLGAKRH